MSTFIIFNILSFLLFIFPSYIYPSLSLSKVTLLEDGDGNIHLKNLSMHQAANEEDGETTNN